jgi:hypothetical protein
MNATNRTRYVELDFQAGKIRNDAMRVSVEHILDQAWGNAEQTIFVEKARTVAEWDDMFVGTIQTILAFGKYKARTVAWFAKRGITY